MLRHRWIAIAALAVVPWPWLCITDTRARQWRRRDVAIHRDTFRSYVTASGEIVATRFADIGSSVMGRSSA
jgi:hypothetical protein